MRISLDWLKEFIPLTADADEIAHRLTMLGLEIEAVERVDGDAIFEVNVTPNRPDCLSVVGIARELSAAYDMELTIPEHDIMAEPGELDFNVDILDVDLCHRYAGRIVRNLTIGESPDWLKRRLEKCGLRAINNVVDVTNYVLLELGHPLHAFDLATLKGHRIRVATPATAMGKGATAKLTTLDGVEREIPGDALLIWDAVRPVAVAGVMGGQETEVSGTTVDIFIESAYFDPVSVRKTSKTLGLKTEASYRFERGTDIKMLKKALDRTAYLMKEVADGMIYGKIDIYPRKHVPAEISLSADKVNRVLGLSLSTTEMVASLEKLGFSIEESGGLMSVRPPVYRGDVKRDADIIEEVARTCGYERIPAVLPKATLGISDAASERLVEGEGATGKGFYERALHEVKQSLLKTGFTEVINLSFMGEQDLDLLGIAAPDRRRKCVRIKNPLRTEESLLRTTLVPSLLRNMAHNASHGNRDFRLFELSRVFVAGADGTLPLERYHGAALLYREKTKSLYREETQEFFVVKGAVEALFDDLKIREYTFVRSAEPFLHPGQAADIMIEGSKVGYIGTLSPVVRDALEIKAQKPAVVVMELDIDLLLPFTIQMLKYRPLPRFPYIERDTALIVDAGLEAAAVLDWLRSYPADLIEEVALFDVYQGKNIPEGKKSIAFTVRYRAADRTLTDEEIDPVHTALVAYITDKTKGALRS